MSFDFYFTSCGFDFATSFAIPMSSGRALKKTFEMSEDENQCASIVMIYCNGNCSTGVVIAKREEPLEIMGKSISSIVLTAGHSIGRNFIKKISNIDEVFIATSKGVFRGIILTDLSNIQGQPLLDPVSGVPYALSDDLGLILIVSAANSSIESMKIAEITDIEENLFISGYPKRPKSILYCSPFLRNQPEEEYKKLIDEAFCGFCKKVKSDGVIKILRLEPNMLLAADYSATKGMSGGPVYVEKEGQKLLIGINCGGCSIPFQAEIIKIIPLVLEGNFSLALTTLLEIRESIQKSAVYDSTLINDEMNYLVHVINSRKVEKTVDSFLDLINILPLAFSFPEELNHNLSVPIWSDVMKKVKRICEVFMVLPPCKFDSVLNIF